MGFSFRPTDEELINYYLKNKIMGKAWVVDDAISEINIYFYEPKFLPCKFLNFSSPSKSIVISHHHRSFLILYVFFFAF